MRQVEVRGSLELEEACVAGSLVPTPASSLGRARSVRPWAAADNPGLRGFLLPA